jgi:DNA-binding IclR family transcriptional regulator
MMPKVLRHGGERPGRDLLAWIGADAPIREADIKALSGRPGTTVRRMLQFLDERGMVIPAPARQGTAIQLALTR